MFDVGYPDMEVDKAPASIAGKGCVEGASWYVWGEKMLQTHGSVTCPRCGSNRIFRKERMGLFQRRIFPLLGLYPWECRMCRLVCLMRRRYHAVAPSVQETGPAEVPNSRLYPNACPEK
jgi:hypothetical protein